MSTSVPRPHMPDDPIATAAPHPPFTPGAPPGGAVLEHAALEAAAALPCEAADLVHRLVEERRTLLARLRDFERDGRESEALAEVTRAVGESLRLPEVLDLILRHATALLRVRGAGITRHDGDTLEFVAAVGIGAPLVGTRVPVEGSLNGRAFATRAPVIANHAEEMALAYGPAMQRIGAQRLLVVPLVAGARPVGTLAVANRAVPFGDTDARTLQRLADQVAAAVMNARLFAEAASATRQWEVAFDALAAGMVVLDAEGCIRRCNARALALCDARTASDLYGRPFHEAVLHLQAPPPHCVLEQALVHRTAGRGMHRSEVRGRIYEMVASPLPEGGAVVTFDDVTSHHLLTARHRLVVETTTEAIVVTDPARRIAFANPAAAHLFGRSADALLGTPASVQLAPECEAAVAAAEAAALAGVPQRYETVIVRADGARRTVAVRTARMMEGEVVSGIVASLRDITDERASEEALRRSEARYAHLVESATDAIFTLDGEGRFTSVNRSLERTLGRSRADLVGTHALDVLDPADRAVVQALFEATSRGERQRAELRYRDADGAVRIGSITTTPIFEHGRVTGGLGIVRDVTEERQLAAQLHQHEKLAAVGQLVSGVAHELNNPLAGVMAFSQVLLADASLPEEHREAAAAIHKESRRAARIVANLLLFARQREPERTATDLNQVLLDTLELRRYALHTGQIELVTELAPALPRTWADPFQLQQVILNLLTNAEQALADGQRPRRITVRTAQRGHTLVASVGDTGPGVPTDLRDRIFNPFYTTKGVGEGTGLGLSISHGIVREHGGEIRVEAAPGGGALFVIELPLVPPRAPDTGAPAAPAAPASPRTLLVVDDEPAIRTAVARFLQRAGHAVEIASSGREALERLGGRRYDGVLLDLRMPDMGGDAVYRTILERDPEQARRVIFATGETESARIRGFLRDAGRLVLEKPFDLDRVALLLCGAADHALEDTT